MNDCRQSWLAARVDELRRVRVHEPVVLRNGRQQGGSLDGLNQETLGVRLNLFLDRGANFGFGPAMVTLIRLLHAGVARDSPPEVRPARSSLLAGLFQRA